LRSKNICPALVVDLNCGLRDKELRELRWQQIDLVHKMTLTVGKSKSQAGTGRVIPLSDTVLAALENHAAWYVRRFGECRPEWYVFPAGKGQPNDPTRSVTSLKTAWTKVREKVKVVGRWHDNRYTLVTELAESGAGDEVIMSIAGHVSRAMLSRYSHVRMEAKRRAVDEIAARKREYADDDPEYASSVMSEVEYSCDRQREAARELAVVALVIRFHCWIENLHITLQKATPEQSDEKSSKNRNSRLPRLIKLLNQLNQRLGEGRMDPLFQATVEATEEAIINAMVAADTMGGVGGRKVVGLPHGRLREVMKKYRR